LSALKVYISFSRKQKSESLFIDLFSNREGNWKEKRRDEEAKAIK